ncbi:MAG: HlyD family secretion protein [Armatimonadota bacterium]
MAVSTRPIRSARPGGQPERKQRGRPWWYYLLGAVILLALAGAVWGGYAAWFSLTHVRASYARVTGLVVNMAAKNDTRVQRVLVRTGDHVKKGQVVATLDQADLEAEAERAEATLAAQQSELARAERELELTIRQSAANVDQADAQLAAARARLEQAEVEAKMEARQQPDEVRKAAADLESARSKLKDAEATLRRMEKLSAEGAVSEQSLDQARTQQRLAEAAVESAEAALAVAHAADYQSQIRQQAVATRQAEALQAQAGVRSAEAQGRQVYLAEQQVLARRAAVDEAAAAVRAAKARVSDTELRSPVNGVVVKGPGRSVKDGEAVQNGEPIVTVLATDVPFWISASVSELYASRVKEGQPVLIRIDSIYTGMFGNKWLHGKVEKVGAATEFAANESTPWMVQQVPIKIAFDPGNLPVKHGATCRAWIDIRK